MKKQTMKTKLTLNKFKVASISNFGKQRIIGGDGTDDGDITITKPTSFSRPTRPTR